MLAFCLVIACLGLWTKVPLVLSDQIIAKNVQDTMVQLKLLTLLYHEAWFHFMYLEMSTLIGGRSKNNQNLIAVV